MIYSYVRIKIYVLQYATCKSSVFRHGNLVQNNILLMEDDCDLCVCPENCERMQGSFSKARLELRRRYSP